MRTAVLLLLALAGAPSLRRRRPTTSRTSARTRSATTTSTWQIYTTDHFEIYYYPEIEPHLEKIAGYAESAYQHVSSELKHDLAFKVPLILFSTAASSGSRTSSPARRRKASARSPNRAATAS